MHYTVLTSSKSKGVGNGLTYESEQDLEAGSFVKVPLRKGEVEGIVLRRDDDFANEYDCKGVSDIPDVSAFLTQGQIQTMYWMKEYYGCTLRDCLRVFLPPTPWRTLLPRKSDKVASGEGLGARSDKCTMESSLTKDQQAAYEQIKSSSVPSLLFGVTGSGKTEVYAKLIANCIDSGKQAILLLPEILLSEYMVERFQNLIDPEYISVLHSHLTVGQRRKEWRKIHRGDTRLVIGSRSALFAPCRNLGLVIIDEEHEWTYKNEQTPRYHARDTAEKLCEFSNAKLVLGSATPSLESWHKCKLAPSTYNLATLESRYNNAQLPNVRVIDLATADFGDYYPFTPPLVDAIQRRLADGEQSVLFLNRKGHSSAMLCMDCRRRIVCPDSALPYSVFTDRTGSHYLLDRLTGVTASIPEKCPACQSTNLQMIGVGTQKIESLISQLFPSARVLRADSDTLSKPEAIRELLTTMQSGKADILLGTQSVVKGLDLPNVTLAAVLLADIGLSLPTFRAGERIFQLLTQLTGRSGRHKSGDVIVQTYRPDAAEICFAANHNTEEFLNAELMSRDSAKYPPRSSMLRLIFRSDNCLNDARAYAEKLKGKYSHLSISASEILYSIPKKAQVIVRGDAVEEIMNTVPEGVVVDRDPLDLL